MARRTLIAGGALLFSALSPTFAAADEMSACAGKDDNLVIQACTSIIKSSKIDKLTKAEAYYHRGYSFIKRENYKSAISDFTKAIALKPDYGLAYSARGLAHERFGDADADTQADYKRASALLSPTAKMLPPIATTVFQQAAPKPEMAASPKLADHTPPPVVASDNPTVAAPSEAAPTISNAVVISRLHRVALVIGNSDYRSVGSLQNPVRDADLVGNSLHAAGVDDVTIAHNLDHKSMIEALKTFADKADNADWAIVYYAGHGIEMDGHNYLIPIDAVLAADRDVPDETISLDRMMNSISGARQLKLVVLDACRNNPFHPRLTVATRSIDRGLSRVEPDDATLVVYAAKEGTVAKDGDGGDSPFATSFAKRVDEPGVEINKVLRFVRQDVLESTGRQQEPFVYGSLPPTDFFFIPPK